MHHLWSWKAPSRSPGGAHHSRGPQLSLSNTKILRNGISVKSSELPVALTSFLQTDDVTDKVKQTFGPAGPVGPGDPERPLEPRSPLSPCAQTFGLFDGFLREAPTKLLRAENPGPPHVLSTNTDPMRTGPAPFMYLFFWTAHHTMFPTTVNIVAKVSPAVVGVAFCSGA